MSCRLGGLRPRGSLVGNRLAAFGAAAAAFEADEPMLCGPVIGRFFVFGVWCLLKELLASVVDRGVG